MTSEETIQIIFCGVYYLTVLVYTKTTIQLSVQSSYTAWGQALSWIAIQVPCQMLSFFISCYELFILMDLLDAHVLNPSKNACLQPVVHLKMGKWGTRILRWTAIRGTKCESPPVNTTFLQTSSKTYIAKKHLKNTKEHFQVCSSRKLKWWCISPNINLTQLATLPQKINIKSISSLTVIHSVIVFSQNFYLAGKGQNNLALSYQTLFPP